MENDALGNAGMGPEGQSAPTAHSESLQRTQPDPGVGSGPNVEVGAPFLTSRKPSRRKRARVSAKNRLFGIIAGAYQGGNKISQYPSQLLAMVPHELQTFGALVDFVRPSPIPRNLLHDSKDKLRSSWRAYVYTYITHLCEGSQVASQAEVLALETNSWIHVVAQHQTSGENFYSYISPRLLRDDNEGVNYIQQIYSRLFAGVKKAARTEALDMMKQLTEQREAAEAAERERKSYRKKMSRWRIWYALSPVRSPSAMSRDS